MSLADNIQRLRRKKQWTQPQLAEKADISKGYVYMLESGEMTNPSLDILLKIADAFETTIAELVDEPRTASVKSEPNIPDALAQFAKHRKKAGEPLSEDDILSLARTQFRGKRPESIEDWAYVYEFLKRTLGERRK